MKPLLYSNGMAGSPCTARLSRGHSALPPVYQWHPFCVPVTCMRREAIGGRHPPKSSQEFPAQYIEQDAKQGPSSQFVERAGSGLKALFQQQRAAWAECTCAGARMSISLSLSVARVFLNPVSLTQRDEA